MRNIRQVERLQGGWIRYIAAVVALAALVVVWLASRPKLAIDTSDTGVSIAYNSWLVGKQEIAVNFADVREVRLFDQAPPMQKQTGSDAGRTRIGAFTADQLGSFKAAIADETRPALYVRTDTVAFMFTPKVDAVTLMEKIQAQMKH
jgi:hypothetical protein